MKRVSQDHLGLSHPPYAAKFHSSQESLHILRENADYLISQYGERKYLLRHLVVDCIEKLSSPVQRKKKKKKLHKHPSICKVSLNKAYFKDSLFDHP